MANSTVRHATTVHGTNPQYLIEKIIRSRIYETKYWKESCSLLNSALVVQKAVDDLRYIGGVYGGNIKPTPFLCLALKLLQIQPKIEIIHLYIDQPDFKYLRALGAFYLRLVGNPAEVYAKLEPLYRDYRKLRIVDRAHNFCVIHMDELVDQFLRDERVFDVILPRLTKRIVLEENGQLKPYKSDLEDLNLIPTQIIEEKVEQAVERDRRRSSNYDRHSDSRHRSSSSRHRSDRHRDYDEGTTETDYVRHEPRIKSRFSQEEIDSENAIRARVGLKPLR